MRAFTIFVAAILTVTMTTVAMEPVSNGELRQISAMDTTVCGQCCKVGMVACDGNDFQYPGHTSTCPTTNYGWTCLVDNALCTKVHELLLGDYCKADTANKTCTYGQYTCLRVQKGKCEDEDGVKGCFCIPLTGTIWEWKGETPFCHLQAQHSDICTN
jgi:hypothetical protein